MNIIELAAIFEEKVTLNDLYMFDKVDRWSNPNYDCLVIIALASRLAERRVTMNKIELAVRFAEEVALNNLHGYDQVDRWGNPNYDCSGLVISALENSGIPAKTNGATYTGNMYDVLLKTGFTDISALIRLSNGEGLQRGDILLTPYKHTAFYCGNGKLVDASKNENGGIKGGQTGDQTGEEISIRNYYDYPWKYVLRYVSKEPVDENKIYEELATQVIQGKWGNGEERKVRITASGYSYERVQKIVNERLSGKYASNKDIETIAKEVIQGKWGNGKERKRRLKEADIDYNQVQAMVNKMLGK